MKAEVTNPISTPLKSIESIETPINPQTLVIARAIVRASSTCSLVAFGNAAKACSVA